LADEAHCSNSRSHIYWPTLVVLIFVHQNESLKTVLLIFGDIGMFAKHAGCLFFQQHIAEIGRR